MALGSKLQILEGEQEAVVWSRSRLDQGLLLAQPAGTLPGTLWWGQVKSHLWLKGAQELWLVGMGTSRPGPLSSPSPTSVCPLEARNPDYNACAVDCTSEGLRILQARILEWVAIPFTRGSFQPRDRLGRHQGSPPRWCWW